MTNAFSPGPVVVAVNGSNAAIGAAEWGAKEAVHQGVALRLVHVIHAADASMGSAAANGPEERYSENALHAASSAVKATGLPVTGRHRSAARRRRFGADRRVRKRHPHLHRIRGHRAGSRRNARVDRGDASRASACPVAIIRGAVTTDRFRTSGFIAVVLDGDPGDEIAMQMGDGGSPGAACSRSRAGRPVGAAL